MIQKKILILGATGNLGKSTAYALKEAGFEVRILTRDAQKAGQLFGSTYEVMAGNPTDMDCLEKAMDGCHGVHISLPTEVEQQVAEMVAMLAPRRGVKHLTYISGASVGEENRWFPMVDRKFLAEKALREAGIACTILCPTWVMESLPLFVNQGQAMVLGKQPCAYHWVAAADIAGMVVNAFSLGDQATGRFVVLGPQAIKMHEALRRYCTAFHPEIKRVAGMPFLVVRMMAFFTGDKALKGAVEMMAYFERVGEGGWAVQAKSVLGMPAITLDNWLQRGMAG